MTPSQQRSYRTTPRYVWLGRLYYRFASYPARYVTDDHGNAVRTEYVIGEHHLPIH